MSKELLDLVNSFDSTDLLIRHQLSGRPLPKITEIPDEMPKIMKDRFEGVSLSTSLADMFKEIQPRVWDTQKEAFLKDVYQGAGMFGFVSWRWVNPLVKWLNGRKVLEVMAGRGWLAKALREKGVEVIAIDNNYRGLNSLGQVSEVEEMDAIKAVELYGNTVDIVIMSWPEPNNTAYKVLKRLHEVNPNAILLYIGEISGCTANDKFDEHFEHIHDPSFDLVQAGYQQWHAFHDYPILGRYSEEEV